jgi:uncharacterized protein (TIGR00725 family)
VSSGPDSGQVYVAVVGPGVGAAAALVALAREVGRRLADRGAVLVTGGLGGVMAAAAEGASSAGGTSIGLLPGGDRRAGNAHSSVLVATGLGELRNAVLVRGADAIIAVGGSWGTLSEIALARRAGVPVVCIEGWSVLGSDGAALPLDTAQSPAEAVRRVLEQMAAGSDGSGAPGSSPGKMER